MADSIRFIFYGFQQRARNTEETLKRLREHGFSPGLDAEIKKILRKFRERPNIREGPFTLVEAEEDLMPLKLNWQKEKKQKKKRRNNAVASAK